MFKFKRIYMKYHKKRNTDTIFQVKFLTFFKWLIFLGYCGFIPAIRAANMYGNTYGVITGKCASGDVHYGKGFTFAK